QLGPLAPNPAESVSTCLGLVIGIWLFVVGLWTVRGTASDVFVTSFLSMLLGLFCLAIGALGFGMDVLKNRPEQAAILGSISGGLGLGLILPAVLALLGRSRYLEWRESNARSRRDRRRRPQDWDDENEPEDRPRPRQRDDDW